MKKISVIIPVYNQEKLLNNAITSVINQSFGFENIELILIDDKSTDNTKSVIESYAEKYDNIVPIFLEENSGNPSKARNRGIEYSTTNYIMFLDNDDEYDSKICEKLYDKIINDESLDFVACGFQTNSVDLNFDYNNSDFVKFEGNYPNSEWKNIMGGFWKMESKSMILFSLWNKIFKKSFLNGSNIRFSKYLFEDVNFMTICFIHTSNFGILNNYIGYFHKYRSDSRMNTFSTTEYLDIMDGGLYTYNILKKENSDLMKFYFVNYSPTFFVSNFLLLDLNTKDLKKVFNSHSSLFKEGIKLSHNRFYRFFLRIFNTDFRIAIIMNNIFRYLKFSNIFHKFKR